MPISTHDEPVLRVVGRFYASVPKQTRAALHERLAELLERADGELARFHHERARRLRDELSLADS